MKFLVYSPVVLVLIMSSCLIWSYTDASAVLDNGNGSGRLRPLLNSDSSKVETVIQGNSFFIIKIKIDSESVALPIIKEIFPKVEPLFESHEIQNTRNSELRQKIGLDRIYLIYPIERNASDQCSALLESKFKTLAGQMEYVEPVYDFRSTLFADDSLFFDQWGLFKTFAPDAWNFTTGSEDVLIAILDSGVDTTHADLKKNIWINPGEDLNGNNRVDPEDFNNKDDDHNGFIDDLWGWDFVSAEEKSVYPGEDAVPRDNDPSDFDGHGTLVAGIAGACGDNANGIAGMAFSAKIVPVRVSYKHKSGDVYTRTVDLARGISYAADLGCNVINMSLGDTVYSSLIEDAVAYACSLNVLLVGAAGNNGNSIPFYPAAHENVLSVAALDWDDVKADFSNFGAWVDLCAPGVGVYGTTMHGGYLAGTGTSTAAPLVSGLAALVWAQNPLLKWEQVANILVSSAESVDQFNPGYKGLLGAGRINAYKSLSPKHTAMLHISATSIKDSEGDKDNLIEPGETASVVLEITNSWENSGVVEAKIYAPDSLVQLLPPETVSFGSIPSNSKTSNQSNPFKLKVSIRHLGITDQRIFVDIWDSKGYETRGFFYLTVSPQKLFQNVAPVSGVEHNHVTRGIAEGDYNNDGFTDLFVLSADFGDVLYKNNGDGTFSDVSGQAGLSAEIDLNSSCAFLDFNRDYLLDIFVTSISGNNRLYRNIDGTSFVEEGSIRGVSGYKSSSGIAVLDFNRDGYPDIFVSRMGEPNLLFKNIDGISFEEVGATALVNDRGGSIAACASDFNCDGWDDIYVVKTAKANRLYLNNHDESFTESAELSNVAFEGEGRCASVTDFDNDGDPDIYLVNNSRNTSILYRNNGKGIFEDITNIVGIQNNSLQSSATWLDYNLDGNIDLYVVNEDGYPNSFFENDKSSKFAEIGNKIGVDDPGAGINSIAVDFNRNGAPDIYLTNGAHLPNQKNLLYKNGTLYQNWITVVLKGVWSNTTGIGAKIHVLSQGLEQTRVVGENSGYLSQGTLYPVFGLGKAEIIDRIIVDWTLGHSDTAYSVLPGRPVTMVEGTGLDVKSRGDGHAVPGHGSGIQSIFPDPFNPETMISFKIGSENTSVPAKLSIYDVRGALVVTLLNKKLEPGYYSSVWNGTNTIGKTVSSGIYFASLELNSKRYVQKMMLLK